MSSYKSNGWFLNFLRRFRRLKKKIYNKCIGARLGHPPRLSIDPSAQLLGLRHISIGSRFKAGSHLRLEALDAYEDQRFEPRIVIRDNVTLNDFVHIGAIDYVEIGNDVLIASKVYISDHSHGDYGTETPSNPEVPPARRPLSSRPVIIQDNVWLGEFVSVLPGVTIGRGSIIGANSVVAKDIPPHCIAVGAPAQVVKRYDPARKQWERV